MKQNKLIVFTNSLDNLDNSFNRLVPGKYRPEYWLDRFNTGKYPDSVAGTLLDYLSGVEYIIEKNLVTGVFEFVGELPID